MSRVLGTDSILTLCTLSLLDQSRTRKSKSMFLQISFHQIWRWICILARNCRVGVEAPPEPNPRDIITTPHPISLFVLFIQLKANSDITPCRPSHLMTIKMLKTTPMSLQTTQPLPLPYPKKWPPTQKLRTAAVVPQTRFWEMTTHLYQSWSRKYWTSTLVFFGTWTRWVEPSWLASRRENPIPHRILCFASNNSSRSVLYLPNSSTPLYKQLDLSGANWLNFGP